MGPFRQISELLLNCQCARSRHIRSRACPVQQPSFMTPLELTTFTEGASSPYLSLSLKTSLVPLPSSLPKTLIRSGFSADFLPVFDPAGININYLLACQSIYLVAGIITTATPSITNAKELNPSFDISSSFSARPVFPIVTSPSPTCLTPTLNLRRLLLCGCQGLTDMILLPLPSLQVCGQFLRRCQDYLSGL